MVEGGEAGLVGRFGEVVGIGGVCRIEHCNIVPKWWRGLPLADIHAQEALKSQEIRGPLQ